VLIARLVTFVDIADVGDSQLSFSARLDALLVDGRRIVLLDDRGWSQSGILFSRGAPPVQNDPSSPWDGVTRSQLEDTARTVVGPDEAFGDYTTAEMANAHWTHLAASLEKHGVVVDATDLRALRHDVVLSDRLLARLDDGRAQN
jgi:hypothetical protein